MSLKNENLYYPLILYDPSFKMVDVLSLRMNHCMAISRSISWSIEVKPRKELQFEFDLFPDLLSAERSEDFII
jgi:hypothetical protein